jgi:hypothetical protein
LGKFDSSLTRVQPVFEALYQRDTSGETWLGPLLGMGTRGVGPESVAIPPDLGPLEKPPQFEFSADPPKSFLGWLIRHPESLTCLPESEWEKWSERTQRKRRALLAGEAATQAEAIARLEECSRLPQRAWWRLEGVTRVDCALLTSSTVVFVEGKRTEIGPARQVLWHPSRNQVLRVLDCAAAFARQTDRPHYFVMLVVEKGLVEHDSDRQREIEEVVSTQTVRASLPHLNADEQAELLSHYLGTTTWQEIVRTFDLGSGVLLDRIDC